ncbi:MAG: nicotinate-nucleotide adenylyltransferase [Nitrospinales bacterium]
MSEGGTEHEGLLGGSFDPVHYGHLRLAAETRERFRLDRVVFVPAHVSPHKRDQPVTPARHRREMLRLALLDEPAFGLSDIELQRKGVSYTVDTLEALRAEGGVRKEFYLIMASDTFRELGAWKDYRRILELVHVLVAARPGEAPGDPAESLRRLFQEPSPYEPPSSGENMREYRRRDNGRRLVFFQLKTPMAVSSCQIRDRIHQKASIKNFLPPQVEHYIIENNLYGFTKPNPQSFRE